MSGFIGYLSDTCHSNPIYYSVCSFLVSCVALLIIGLIVVSFCFWKDGPRDASEEQIVDNIEEIEMDSVGTSPGISSQSTVRIDDRPVTRSAYKSRFAPKESVEEDGPRMRSRAGSSTTSSSASPAPPFVPRLNLGNLDQSDE